MLRDVSFKVSDGLLGLRRETGDGVHIKVGVSNAANGSPVAVTGDMDAAQIKERLGLSPLADAAMDAVQAGAGKIWCIGVKPSSKGSVGAVTHEGTGGGTVTVTGEPSNAFDVIVKITGTGGLNAAAFAVSIDGGYSFTDEATVPLTGQYQPIGTNLTLTFAADGEAVFQADDTYRFQTTAPVATNGEILAALEQIKHFHKEFEFIHIVGGSGCELWTAVSAFQQELATISKMPAFVLMEAQMPDSEELEDWAAQMENNRRRISNSDIQVCAAWGRLLRLDGTTQTVNLAGAVSGRYAKAAVQKSIGQTRAEAGMGFERTVLTELLPAGYDNEIIDRLDRAGYLTFREYDGLDLIYVYHANMMCATGSDYRYAEDVRVRNKVIREVRKEALLQLGDDIDLSDLQHELEVRVKFVTAALDRMVAAKEISDYEAAVADGLAETFHLDETLRMKVRYLSRGYIREVLVDLGRAAPNA